MIASKAWADIKHEINSRIDTLINEQKTYLAKLDRELADWKKKKTAGDKSAEKKFVEVSDNLKKSEETLRNVQEDRTSKCCDGSRNDSP